MTELLTDPVKCMFVWTVLILSIYAYWCYSDWNKKIEWMDHWYGYTRLERSILKLVILFAPWFFGIALLIPWYIVH